MRLFDEHVKRKTYLLDGMWDFVADEAEQGMKEEWYRNFPEKSMQVTVPGCINNRLGYMEFQNIAWYRKEFYAKGWITLKFYAVSEYARVYLDGEYLGDHYGGFTAFEFDKEVYAGKHSLVVMVDSRSTEDTIPLYRVDWHHYCGIMRSVEVAELTSTAIKSMKVHYILSDDLKNADMKIYIRLQAYGKECVTTECKVDIDGQVLFQKEIEIGKDTEICVEGSIQDIRLWDIGCPELYTLTVQTKEDDLIDRIGFRTIKVQGKRILLNNKPIQIRGVNRHEEHPDWGFAMPAALNARDMDILKDLNVNAVRGSHYPNSKLFVDMCDAEGILFWSEIPMWGFSKVSVERPLVIKRGLEMHSEMVEQYFNHPSIVIWCMHNEIATDSEQGYNITKKFVEHVKKMDTSRLITCATARPLTDICMSLVDFVSINKYVGWYEEDIKDWGKFIADLKRYLKEQGVDNKPVIMSEFGVGAMFGNKTFESLRWSENYQVEFYEHTLNLFLEDELFSGVYLWQFSDIRSSAKWNLLRVRSFNNKGLINEYRLPKLAYYKVKEIFEQARKRELQGKAGYVMQKE